MDDFKELEPTGREIHGPIETLVEYKHSNGLKRFAIEFSPQFRAHPELGFGLQSAMGFISEPNVTNLIEMSEMDPRRGAFAYSTGTCWPLSELMQKLAQMGKKAGARAGLELCYQAASVLHEANQSAPSAGLYCHGNLNPWRIMVKVDGQIQIIGYGLPQVDVLVYREEDGALPNEDGLRYCPPERLEGNPEDVPGDILSLALIAFELMVGEPLYNGIAKEIHSLAINGNGPYRLFQYRDVLPESVIELLSTALKYDADARFADANEFLWAVKDVMGLPSIDGMSLAEVVQAVRRAEEHGEAIQGGNTNSVSSEDLKAIRELLDAPAPTPLPEPSEEPKKEEDEGPRWASARRSRGGQGVPEDEPEITIEPPEVASSQAKRSEALRARLRQSKEDRRKSLKDRLRSSKRRPVAEASEESDAAVDEESDTPQSDASDVEQTNVEAESAGEANTDESIPPVDSESPEAVDIEETAAPTEEPMDTVDEPKEQESEEAPEETEVSEKPEDAAAALLARLRSSQTLRVSQSAEPEGPQDGEENTSTTQPTATSKAPEPEVEETVPEPVEEVEQVMGEVSQTDAVVTIRTPPKPSAGGQLGASGTQRVAFQVALQGYAARTVKLKLSDSVASTASRLGQALGGMPTDLLGRVTGWYRIMQNGHLMDGADATGSLDPNSIVEIVRVSGEVFHVTIVIHDGESTHRFQTPVSTGIPCAFLLSHLISWLSLSDGDWTLKVNEEAILPMQTLMEANVEHGAVIEVSK